MKAGRGLLAAGIITAFIFAIVGSVWLSFSAETLDELAAAFGVSESSLWNPPISDYQIVELEGNIMANIVIGLVFTALTLAVTLAVGKCLSRRSLKEEMC